MSNSRPFLFSVRQFKSLGLGGIVLLVLAVFAVSCNKEAETTNPPNDVFFSAVYVLGAQKPEIDVINIANNYIDQNFTVGGDQGAHRISGHPNGSVLAISVAGEDLRPSLFYLNNPGSVRILDARTGDILRTIQTPKGVWNAAFTANGNQLWVALGDTQGTIRVYETQGYSLTNSFTLGSPIRDVAFNKFSEYGYVALPLIGKTAVIDPATFAEVVRHPTGKAPIMLTPKGNTGTLLVTSLFDSTVTELNGATLGVVKQLSFKPGRPSWSRDASEYWIPNPEGAGVHYFSGALAELGEVSTGAGARSVVFAPDGKWAYCFNESASTFSYMNVAGHYVNDSSACATKPVDAVLISR
jgi:WD40 repeat protein